MCICGATWKTEMDEYELDNAEAQPDWPTIFVLHRPLGSLCFAILLMHLERFHFAWCRFVLFVISCAFYDITTQTEHAFSIIFYSEESIDLK